MGKIKIIYLVSNKVSNIFFESEEDAENYAAQFPATAGMGISEIEVVKSENRCTCWRCMGLTEDPYAEDEGRPIDRP